MVYPEQQQHLTSYCFVRMLQGLVQGLIGVSMSLTLLSSRLDFFFFICLQKRGKVTYMSIAISYGPNFRSGCLFVGDIYCFFMWSRGHILRKNNLAGTKIKRRNKSATWKNRKYFLCCRFIAGIWQHICTTNWIWWVCGWIKYHV